MTGILHRRGVGVLVFLLVPFLVLPSVSLRISPSRTTSEIETTFEETEDAESLAVPGQRRSLRKRNHCTISVGKVTLLPPESDHCPSCRLRFGSETPLLSFAKRNQVGSPLRC